MNEIDSEQIRFFLGYSGWSPNQLDQEMLDGSWFVSEVQAQQVMQGKQKQFWNESLVKMGGKFGLISNFPENPQLN